MYLVQQLDFMKRNFYWIHICGLERQGLQESHLYGVAFINGSFYGRLYRQFTRAKPNKQWNWSSDTFRGASSPSTAKTIPTETFDKSSWLFWNRDRLTNPRSVTPHCERTVLSSAIILQNSIFQATGRPRQSARGLQWCPARPAGHYFSQILNMTSFILAKPTGRSLATGQDRKSFGAILS